MSKKNVVLFGKLPQDLSEQIKQKHNLIVLDIKTPEGCAAFLKALPNAHGLIGASYSISPDMIEQSPNLAVISSISVGVDNYPHQTLKEKGIALCHTPGVLTETTADTIFGLLMCTLRRFPELSKMVEEGRWTQSLTEEHFGWDVHGKTMGILGFGRIGQAVARRGALGFGMKVLYQGRASTQVPEDLQTKVQAADLDEVLAQSDVLVLTVPLTDATKGLINAQTLAKMKAGAVLINGARGPVVDEDALLNALNSGHLKAAGLDVFAVEPLPYDSALRNHPKVVPFPHAGSATFETRRAMAELAVDNLLAVLDGKSPKAAYDLSKI